MGNGSSIDAEMLKEFLDESQDRLKEVVSYLVELENNPENESLINKIFLPVHTIKGNCAYFGLIKTKNLTHELETILDQIRKKSLSVTTGIISLLIEGIEYLSGILRRLQTGETEVLEELEFELLVDNVKKINLTDTSADNLSALKNIKGNLEEILFTINDKENCEKKIRNIVESINKLVSASEIVNKNEVLLPVDFYHYIKLLCLPLNELKEGSKYKEIGAFLTQVIACEMPLKLKTMFNESLENYKVMTTALGYDELLHMLLNESLVTIRDQYTIKSNVEGIPPAPKKVELVAVKEKSGGASENSHAEEVKTMRIAESTIDGFLSEIGELVIVREMFDHFFKKTAESFNDLSIRNELRRLNDIFTEVTYDLESSVMKIRKQSVKKIFQRVSKLVRDITKINHKEIEVKIKGGDIEVDKSLLDILDGPLMHMIRNAVDHGIEMPEERKKIGKNPKGCLEIIMEEEEDILQITIADDGKGLNLKRIFEKAVSLGLVNSSANLSDQEKMALIFHPGLSTAEKVSDISGRGVGMDVVKTDIEKAGGKVNIESILDKGTTFNIVLPKSVMTQIIQGFVVKVSENEYVIPIYKILESFPCVKSDITVVKENEFFVKRHGYVIPVVELGMVFDQKSANGNFENGIFIFIEEMNKRIALYVDKLLGIQQVVVKPLKGIVLLKEIFSGGALMGDGNVALVVSTDYFFNEYK